MQTFLSQIGVQMNDVFAGFAGGVVAALVTSGSRPSTWDVFSAIVVGAITGAYLGPVAPTYVGAKPSAAASFVVGLGGMPICRAVIAGLKRLRWSPLESGPVERDRTDE